MAQVRAQAQAQAQATISGPAGTSVGRAASSTLRWEQGCMSVISSSQRRPWTRRRLCASALLGSQATPSSSTRVQSLRLVTAGLGTRGEPVMRHLLRIRSGLALKSNKRIATWQPSHLQKAPRKHLSIPRDEVRSTLSSRKATSGSAATTLAIRPTVGTMAHSHSASSVGGPLLGCVGRCSLSCQGNARRRAQRARQLLTPLPFPFAAPPVMEVARKYLATFAIIVSRQTEDTWSHSRCVTTACNCININARLSPDAGFGYNEMLREHHFLRPRE